MKYIKLIAGLIMSYTVKFAKWIWSIITRLIKGIHLKKRYYIPFYVVLGYFLFVFLLVKTSGDGDYNKVLPDQRVNDVTQINPIQVGRCKS